MMPGQEVSIPRLGRPQDNFLYWLAQMKAILKSKRVQHVVRDDIAVRWSSLHQVLATNARSGEGSEAEYAKDVACSIIVHGLARHRLHVSYGTRRTHARGGSSCMRSTG